MFSLKIARHFSNTSCFMRSRLARTANPGLGHQINAIEDAAKVIQSDPEGFAGLESDLFDAHKSHKEHELALKHRNEKIKQCIIKNRYFRKDPLPNLLTYSEKEHVRFLHSTDEEEWTVEKLAESFPANAEIIHKILKTRWSPISLKRIRSHDASVSKNWKRFNDGEYKANMTAELYEHLKKFSDRGANNMNILHDPSKALKKQWQKPISNEFSSIISSLQQKRDESKKLTTLHSKPTANKIRTNSVDSETYLLGEIINKKAITIHELKNKHLFKTTEDKNLNNSLDQLAAQKLENVSGTGIIEKNNSSTYNATADYTDKFILNEVVISEFDRKRYAMSATKQRICIPRKLWRKGETYRAINCYYDDDGEFLYKVPEMTLK